MFPRASEEFGDSHRKNRQENIKGTKACMREVVGVTGELKGRD